MTKIIQRHDTAANWTSVNPVLAAGEMGVETDTNKFKFGDGVTAWTGLAYAAGEGGGGTTLTSTDGTTTYSKLALGDTLSVIDTSTKELNKLTQTGGTLNSELEFTGASGASLKMTEKYSLSTADSWEFQTKYKHNGGGNNPCVFGYASGSDNKTPCFILEGGSFKFFLSSTGSSWDINSSGSGLVPQAGTIYYFKIGFTGSQYYIKYNTTGWSDEFTTQWTLNSTAKVYCSDYFMLMNLSLNSDYYNTGTMYLQDTVLIVNGSEVWRGANIISGPLTLNTNIDAYTKAETDDLLSSKQKKLTALSPLAIETYTTEFIAGYGVKETTLEPQNSFSIVAKNNACTVTTASNLTYIDIPININKKQVCTVPFGGLDNKVSNLLFGYHDTEGNFIPVFSFGSASTNYIQYLALNKTPIIPNMSSVSLFTSRMTEYTAPRINISIFDKMYFQVYLEASSFTGFISHRSGINICPAIMTFVPTNIDDIKKITHARYCHNNNYGPFNKSDFGVYTTGELVTTETMTAPIDLSGFKNEFDLNADLSYQGISALPATTSSLGVVQPDGTSITVSETGVISGQDVKTFTGYSDTGTLVLKSINGVLQWVAE